jgi:hypothetical protein
VSDLTLDEQDELELARARAAAKKPAVQPAPAPSELGIFDPLTKAGTALRSFGSAAALGFGDELAGITGAQQELMGRRNPLAVLGGPLAATANAPQFVSAGLEDAGLKEGFGRKGLAERDLEGLGDVEAAVARYRQDRDKARAERAAGVKANPKTALTAQVAGALTTPPVFGAGARLGGMTLKGPGAAVVSGAATGALSGVGSSDAEMPEDIAKEGLTGGALGGVGGAVGAGLGAAAGTGLQKLSNMAALKAMGVKAGISDSLKQRAYETIEEGRALADDAMKSGVIRPFKTAEDVAQQAAERQQYVSGPIIEDVMTQGNAAPQAFDFEEAAWTAADKLMSRGRPRAAPLNPQEQAVGRPAMSMVKRIADTTTPEGLGSFSEANRLKQGLQNSVNYGLNATKESTQMQRAAASGMRESIENQVARNVSPEAADSLRAANQGWGTMEDIKQIATEEARRQAQRSFPLGKALMGAAAGGGASQSVLGGAVGGAAAAAAHYLGPRVPSTVAWGAAKSLPMTERLGPAAASSIADPLGPLRQYLGLSPEDRLKKAADDFSEGGP